MRKIILYFILLTVVYSCSLTNSENTNSIKTDYKENLRIYLSDNYKKINQDSEIQQIKITNNSWINKFYNELEHTPIWINDSLELNNNGFEFILLLSTSYNYGLDSSRYYSHYLNSIPKKLKPFQKKKSAIS
ncbi:MAG: hypothetical protein JKY30_09175 [Flavobacteriales bacterium]|nr:hypothetical protein [Flavobacteriales bacterium]